MSRARTLLHERPWVVAWIGFVLVTAVAVLADDWGVFAPDTKPELYLNPGRLLQRARYAWQADPHLGQVNYNTGILPVAAIMTALHATGLAPWLLQRLVMIVTLLAGAWGAARLVTELSGRTGAGPWLAGIVHAWHPWTVVGAATLPVRLPHAVLPWMLLATHRAVTSGGSGRIAIAGLTYGAMAGINGGVVNLMYVVPVLVLVVWDIATGQAPMGRALGRFAMVGIVAVGVSLYWLVPSIAAATTSAGEVLAVTEDPTAIGQLSPPGEVVRGLGMWTSYIIIDGEIENLEQLALLTNPAVVVAGFLLTVLGIVALVGADRRMRGLVAAMGVTGLALLLGVNGSGGASPLAHGLQWLFDNVPASAAFRTTNKLGTMLVLALALAIGAGIGTGCVQRLVRVSSGASIAVVVGVVAVAAGPVLPGQLHPLQIPVPDYWFAAAAATDVDAESRLLFLPGNAQTRYLWGHRGVDDLDTALFDDRHVVWRSTIPAGSAPATNLLTAFDLGLQLGSLAPASIAAHTQLLGAGNGLVRTDTDWVRNFGRPTGSLRDEVLATPGAQVLGTFGPTGGEREIDPGVVPEDVPALTHIAFPETGIPQAWALTAPLLVVGDAMAIDQLVRAGVDPTGRPLLYLDDLTDAQLVEALGAGGEVVLTDTNHRRSWAISSLTDSYTPLLRGDEEVAPSEQRARTTDPVHQTVTDDLGPTVTALPDPYAALRRRAAGRPALAFDSNPLTGWQHGSRTSGVGGWVEARQPTAVDIDGVRVTTGTSGKVITALRIDTDAGFRVVPVVDGVATADISGRTERVRVTITGTTGPAEQPATVLEVAVDAGGAWQRVDTGAQLPATLQSSADAPSVAAALAAAPFRLLFARLAGDPTDAFDDEEVALRRRFEVPWAVRLEPASLTATVRFGPGVATGDCRAIGVLDDAAGGRAVVRARPTGPSSPGEPVAAEGCGAALSLPAGQTTFRAAGNVVLDHLALATVQPDEEATSDERLGIHEVRRDPTSTTLELDAPTRGRTVISSGRARHSGWQATVDGELLQDTVTVGGYANGWIVPRGTTTIDLSFAPQRQTAAAQAASAITAGAATLVVLVARRRRP